jgi:GDP-mannose 6-dehydrogenase
VQAFDTSIREYLMHSTSSLPVVSLRMRDTRRKHHPAADAHALSVIGLGYVGAVSIACFASLGFVVVGVDMSENKVRDIASGRTPIVEKDLGELLADGVARGKISATTDLRAAVRATSVTLLSVGTPTGADGQADLTQVKAACRAIGEAIARKDAFHVVILRCSVPPGTTSAVVIPALEAASGKTVGEGFGVAFVPEFMREGLAVADFHAPPKTVIGATDKRALATAHEVFGTISEAICDTTIEVAEMVKYVDNVWHATKVVFANEVGRLCQAVSIDSHAVMDVFVKDTKLNISPYYLKPGFAFGGSCLPKEVRAVTQIAAARQLSLPLMESLLPSNRAQIDAALQYLAPYQSKRIGMLGLTFKPATDDIRESPLIELMLDLIARGFDVVAYDPNLKPGHSLTEQLGSLKRSLPHHRDVLDRIPQLLQPTIRLVTSRADVLVAGHAIDQFRDVVRVRRSDQHVVDLARLFAEPPTDPLYQGIAW